MTPEPLENAGPAAVDTKELTRRLLEAMSIKRVINVDDDAFEETEDSLENVIAALRSDTLDKRLVAGAVLTTAETAGTIEPDSDELIMVVQERWGDLSPERRAELTLAANRAGASQEADVVQQSEELDANQAALLALPELLGDSVEFIKMSLAEWRQRGQELLTAKDPTLLLFDRSFEREDQSETAGDELVKEIVSRKDLPHIRVGLLTHTVADVGHETEHAKMLTLSVGEPARQVIVIAKSRLASSTFPEALRMVLYADELEDFRQHAIASLDEGNGKAIEFLREVERYALMATFEASRREGAFETDNVIRMAGAPARRTVNTRLRDPGFLAGTLSTLRSAAALELYFDGSIKPESLAAIEWQERFDSGQYLSDLGLPVEVGDIFKIYDLLGPQNSKGADRFYILLAQPCDIAVRETGKRGHGLHCVALTRLKPAVCSGEDNSFKPPKDNEADFGRFDLESDEPWRVHFAQQIQVPILALDACVMNVSGRAAIGPDTPTPPALSLSWERRLIHMRTEAKSKIGKLRAMETALAPIKGNDAEAAMRQLAAAIAGAGVRHSTGLTARIDTTGESVEYGVMRHARVTDSTARGLLTLSANHHARPADENALFYKP